MGTVSDVQRADPVVVWILHVRLGRGYIDEEVYRYLLFGADLVE